jgi:hypothetical protein
MKMMSRSSFPSRLVFADAVLRRALCQQLVVHEEVVRHLRPLHVAIDMTPVTFIFEQKVKVVTFICDVGLHGAKTMNISITMLPKSIIYEDL